MAVYCFKCEDCGEKFERRMTFERLHCPTCPTCGRATHRDYRTERFGGHRSACWPQVSSVAGVHPDQVASHRNSIKNKRVRGVEVLDNGDIKWSDRKARKDYMEAFKLFDKCAGYGDASPREYVG